MLSCNTPVAPCNTNTAMDKLEFTVDPDIFENIESGRQKAFVTRIKPSEIHEFFYLTSENKIDVKYFNTIEFKTISEHISDLGDGSVGAEGFDLDGRLIKTCRYKIGYAEIDFLIPNELIEKEVPDLTSCYDCDHMPPVEIMFQLKERLN